MRNFSGEQLKLLYAFKLLFEEGSVVKAASRQNMTQSAVSKQLRKLREWFDDELFVRTASGMEPTERAIQLIDQVEAIVELLDDLDNSRNFQPEHLSDPICIETTDEVSRRITSSFLSELKKQAPSVSLHIKRLNQKYSLADLESGKVDVVVSVNWHAPEQLMQKRLGSDKFVVVMSKTHPFSNKPLTISDYANADHLLVAPLGMRRGFIDEILEQHGYKRNIKLSVPSFSEITHEHLDAGYIVTLPNQVASALTDNQNSVSYPLPFDVPTFNYYMFWHRRFNNNQRNRWVRDILETSFATIQV